MKYRSKLKPQADLKGATPETLAKALLTPRLGGKPVVRRAHSAEEAATVKSGDKVSHLRKSV